MTTFNDFALRKSSLNALERMDITTPTPVQEASIPVMLEKRDIIAQAQTGSGKTLAFALPIMEHCDPSRRETQALILTPTRELARQVGSVFSDLSKGTDLRVTLVYGGVGYGPQENALRKGSHVVVGTPGRVLDHLRKGVLKLDQLRLFILDEADEMLDRGFAPDVERIIKMTPSDRLTAMFSATTPPWVQTVAQKYMNDPEIVASAAEEADPDIEQVVMDVFRDDKFQVLIRLLKEPLEGTTVVFGRTKHGVRALGKKLDAQGFEVSVLEGNLGQNQRDRALDRFRSGKSQVLVATNVAARGLDVLHIARVINFDVPDTAELLTHRIGRTGRMGRSGQAITLVTATDLSKWHEIERKLGVKLPRIPAPGVRQPSTHQPLHKQAAAQGTNGSANGNGRNTG
ncbi:MAG TPA: DEAD/DEAH box helicase [Dehalococcoidia bacterium]|nr:DEAD/DEAH box helicase [Dehalococcoidia bacterium]